MVAPYWDDIDLRDKGLIMYAALIQGQESHLNSNAIFDVVNAYITGTVFQGAVFNASWILAVRWIDTCPFGNPICILVCMYLLLIYYFCTSISD